MENSLIEQANSLDELQETLQTIYQLNREKKKAAPASHSIESIFEKINDVEIRQELSVSSLIAVDELMLILKEYEQDLLQRGSLKALKIYRFYQEQYNNLLQRLEKSNAPIITNEELESFQTKLQKLLANIIQTTQLHLIFMDSKLSLNTAKKLCQDYLLLNDLGNILISYHSTLDFEKVIQKYQSIPSIYVFLGKSNQNREISVISSKLYKMSKLQNDQLISKCFVAGINEGSEIRTLLKNIPLFSFVEELSLFRNIRDFINKSSQIQVLQFLPLDKSASILENTLAFLRPLIALSDENRSLHLFCLGDELKQTFLKISKQGGVEDTYYKLLVSTLECFSNYKEPQVLSKKLLQNFLDYRNFINQCISQEQADGMAKCEDLISSAYLAFLIYREDQNKEIGHTYTKEPIYSAIAVEEDDMSYLQLGKQIILPRFTYSYLQKAQSIDYISSLPVKCKTVILRYQFDEKIRQVNPFKAFRKKNEYLVIMSMPTEVFTITKVFHNNLLNCHEVHLC